MRNKIQHEETRHEKDLPEENHETRNDINNNDTHNDGVADKQVGKLREDDKELERFFQIQIKAMDYCSLLQLEPSEKPPKVNKEIEGSANRILGRYLIDVNTILEIINKVFTMGKAIATKLGMKQPERNGTAKSDVNGGSRREREVRKDIKK